MANFLEFSDEDVFKLPTFENKKSPLSDFKNNIPKSRNYNNNLVNIRHHKSNISITKIGSKLNLSNVDVLSSNETTRLLEIKSVLRR